MIDFSYTILIPLLPLMLFLIIGFFGKKFAPNISGLAGTLSMGTVMILSYYTAYMYFFNTEKIDGAFQTLIPQNFTWLQFSETMKIELGVLLDPISVMMLIVVSTVSFMVHLYSMGYMKGEDGFERFYAFLSLFSFSMLGLVLATNIFQMYIFWELVGVSSFLLIGFYYTKPSAVAASKKAFIVTRFADMGFLIGILLISYYTKAFDFKTICGPEGIEIMKNVGATFMGMSVTTVALLLVFMGGAGKSAMFPLHIWLPDAMEGPTPVSALIHAATMVVAGVYLVARLFPLYYFTSPDALQVIAYVGGLTSLFAAVIAMTQYDIKRILAFSTLSQIGYMMLAVGVSGYGGEEGLGFMASMFHLFTHAMFKALLFLGAGAIIHAVHSNVMNEMGGLRKYLPVTHITFLIACLTIAGLFPLSGFWSKDEILVAAFHYDKFLFGIEFLVAGITAFYMFRLYFRVFWHKEPHYHHKPHEAPLTMTIPLILLAIASIFAGFVPFSSLISSDHIPFETVVHMEFAIPSVAIGVVGILIAMFLYMKPKPAPDKIASALGWVYKTVQHKFYIDEFYLFVTKKIIFNFISRPIAWFDRHIIDGFMNRIAHITTSVSSSIRGLQSGQLQQYGFVFVSGALALIFIFIYLLS